MKNIRTLLFISKDLGGAGVGVPLARSARAAGHTVVVVTEGLASAVYEAAGFTPYLRGPVDAEREPFAVDAEQILEKIRPDAVLVTCSNPIHLEEHFALAANRFNIPLVIVEDFWGGSFQVSAKPQLILTLDEIGAAAIRQRRPDAALAIIGNYAVNEAQAIARTEDLKQKREALKDKFGSLLFFVGGGPAYTGATLKLLKECLAKTTVSWGLIVGFHPKWVAGRAPNGHTWQEVWKDEITHLGNRIVPLDEDSDRICALSDVTFAAFSTMLTKAVVFGRLAVSLVTPEGQEDLRARTTFAHHPLAPTGLVREISAPCDLAPYFEAPAPEAQKISALLKPYDATEALYAVGGIIKAHRTGR